MRVTNHAIRRSYERGIDIDTDRLSSSGWSEAPGNAKKVYSGNAIGIVKDNSLITIYPSEIVNAIIGERGTRNIYTKKLRRTYGGKPLRSYIGDWNSHRKKDERPRYFIGYFKGEFPKEFYQAEQRCKKCSDLGLLDGVPVCKAIARRRGADYFSTQCRLVKKKIIDINSIGCDRNDEEEESL
jgi:hypothetical protein